jgi:hypothetical protein
LRNGSNLPSAKAEAILANAGADCEPLHRLFAKTWKLPDLEPVRSPHEVCRRDTWMRTLVQRLKRLWNTPVEFYGVDRPEPQAGPWHGLLLFVVLLVILGLLWLVKYLPERTYLVDHPTLAKISHLHRES